MEFGFPESENKRVGERKLTITEVAKEAGVSVATVSRVLNGEDCVREATARKGTDAIERLNYVPNVAARNLRWNESRMIMVIANNFTNPYYARVLAGVGEGAEKAGYNVMMCATDGKTETGKKYMHMLENGLADGAILLNATENDVWIKDYAGRHPLVQGVECVEEYVTSKVLLDHRYVGYEGVRYLAGQGHRRIAYISADNNFPSTRGRYAGYCEAMHELGIEPDDSLYAVAEWNYSFESGYRCAERLLKNENMPTAILCVSDTLAISVLLAAEEMGLRVPEDLSVIGCDDIEYSTMKHPFLTTFHIPKFKLGVTCAELLIARIQDKNHEKTIQLDTPLIVRESTGKQIK